MQCNTRCRADVVMQIRRRHAPAALHHTGLGVREGPSHMAEACPCARFMPAATTAVNAFDWPPWVPEHRKHRHRAPEQKMLRNKLPHPASDDVETNAAQTHTITQQNTAMHERTHTRPRGPGAIRLGAPLFVLCVFPLRGVHTLSYVAHPGPSSSLNCCCACVCCVCSPIGVFVLQPPAVTILDVRFARVWSATCSLDGRPRGGAHVRCMFERLVLRS